MRCSRARTQYSRAWSQADGRHTCLVGPCDMVAEAMAEPARAWNSAVELITAPGSLPVWAWKPVICDSPAGHLAGLHAPLAVIYSLVMAPGTAKLAAQTLVHHSFYRSCRWYCQDGSAQCVRGVARELWCLQAVVLAGLVHQDAAGAPGRAHSAVKSRHSWFTEYGLKGLKRCARLCRGCTPYCAAGTGAPSAAGHTHRHGE